MFAIFLIIKIIRFPYNRLPIVTFSKNYSQHEFFFNLLIHFQKAFAYLLPKVCN